MITPHLSRSRASVEQCKVGGVSECMPDSHKYKLFKKAGGRLALSLYVFLPTACSHFELLELVHVDLS